MSFLAHVCRQCNHPDFHHGNKARKDGEGGCSYGWCRCNGDFDPTPTLIDTWPLGKPDQLEPLIQPGERWGKELVTCRCEACQQRYRELSA